jgi:hypothetical protein
VIEIQDSRLYPLLPHDQGPHVFGGPATHAGSTPSGLSVPLHKLLTLDLHDPAVPFRSSKIRFLPLYYPLKYGYGGSSIQYSIISDKEIRILHMSDSEPNSEDEASVRVDAFPEIRYAAQAAISNDDSIDWFTMTLGGTGTLDHQSDQCENKECRNYHTDPDMHLIASIPPKPIPGHQDIWWDFDGAYMLFYFWLCRGCKTICASNRGT